MVQTAEKFLKMDDIKSIIKVEKYNELYDPWHILYKDKCWDAVAANVGATSKHMLLYYWINGRYY